MTRDSREGFLEALAALGRALDELGAPSMIIGGVAVIALGVPRLTIDIDAARSLLLLHGRTMAVDRIRATVRGFAEVLEDVERPRVLDRLLLEAGLEG